MMSLLRCCHKGQLSTDTYPDTLVANMAWPHGGPQLAHIVATSGLPSIHIFKSETGLVIAFCMRADQFGLRLGHMVPPGEFFYIFKLIK